MESQIQDARPRSFHPDYAVPQRGRPGWNLRVERRIDDGRTLARQLGWFSIAMVAAAAAFAVLRTRRLSATSKGGHRA